MNTRFYKSPLIYIPEYLKLLKPYSFLSLQTRDAILKGAHPVTEAQAIQFAALQCQIQFGEHEESKHKPGFLE